jgi:hypothetical protein
MNRLERLLNEELMHLIDRLATSVPEGALDRARAGNPTLKLRLDEMDAALAAVRAALLDGYGRWNRALDDMENLWALAAWRSAAAEEPAEKTSALAA